MDVFTFRDRLVAEYQRFTRSFVTIRAPDIKAHVDREYDAERFWRARRSGGDPAVCLEEIAFNDGQFRTEVPQSRRQIAVDVESHDGAGPFDIDHTDVTVLGTGALGSRTVNAVSWPGSLTTSTLPPIACVITAPRRNCAPGRKRRTIAP